MAEKRLAITVFSFPPDKGNVGTAAYLNVFGSIHRVLQDLQREGYSVGEIPADERALMELVGPLPAFNLWWHAAAPAPRATPLELMV